MTATPAGDLLDLLSCFAACLIVATPAEAGDVYVNLVSSNTNRGAQVYVPSGYGAARRYPLLVVLHPSNGRGAGMEQITNLDPQADRYGFVVAYPDSIGPRWDNQGTTDAAFVEALIATLSTKWSLDPQRVYLAGYSDGGGFAQQLACARAAEFAGFATVGTNMGNSEEGACHPSVPLTYLTFHGTSDPLVPFNGGPQQGPYAHGDPTNSTSQVFQFWAGLDGCGTTQTMTVLADKLVSGGATSDMVTSKDSCRNGTSATFYAINGGGHTWPGSAHDAGDSLGDVSVTLNASAVILKTLGAHRSSAPNTCFEGSPSACAVPHGTGVETCTGGQPGKCLIATCNRGYVLQAGVCASR